MLARMGALLQLPTRPPRSEIVLELKELHVAREALVKDRTAAKNRGQVLILSLLKRQNVQRLDQIERQIAAVEAAMRDVVNSDAELSARFDILTSIPASPPSPPSRSLWKCPNSERSRPARRPVLRGLRPSPAAYIMFASRPYRLGNGEPYELTEEIKSHKKARLAPLLRKGGYRGGCAEKDGSMSTVYLNQTQNVAAIVNANPAGTTFAFAPGVYQDVSITPKNNDSFIGGGSGVVLTGSIPISGWTYSNGYWSAGGFPANGFSPGTANPGRDGLAQVPEDLYVNGTPYLRVGSLSALGAGDFYTSGNGTVYISDNPTGETTTAGVKSSGLNGDYTTGVTVENITFTQYASSADTGAIEAHGSSGWTLDLVNASDNHAAGLTGGSNMTVTDSVFNNNGQFGILDYYASNVVLNGVTVDYNNYAGYSTGDDAGGIKFLVANGVKVENSQFNSNLGTGLWFDTNNTNISVTNNEISYNQRLGMQYEGSFGPTTISGNTFANNDQGGYNVGYWGSGLLIQDSEGVTATNNLVIANPGAQGIGMMDDTRPASSPFPQPAAINNTVEHNTFVYLGSGMSGGASDGAASSQIFNGSNVWDNNTYVAQNAQDVIFTWNNQWYSMYQNSNPLIDHHGAFIYQSNPLAYLNSHVVGATF